MTWKPWFFAYPASCDCHWLVAAATSPLPASALPSVAVQSVTDWSRNGGHCQFAFTVPLIWAKSWLTCWPPKNGDLRPEKAALDSSDFSDGNRLCWVLNIAVVVGLVFRNSANFAAAIGDWVPLITALVDPPQLPDTCSPALHWGSGAARHLPAVDLMEPARNTGAHAAVSQVAYLPLLNAWYQLLVKSGSVETTPSSTSPPQ